MDISSHKALSPRRIATRLALAAAVLMAAGVFAVRGPVYAWNRGADFVLVYGPARALLYGANPYDAADIDRVWAEAGGPFEQRPSTREDGALIYPLTTLAMFAPLAALPWSAAQHAWVITNVMFLAIVVLTTARLAGFCFGRNRWCAFTAAALLFMPVHTTIRVGQTPLFVMALMGLGYVLRERRTAEPSSAFRSSPADSLGGGLLSLACLIKPQIGVPFLAFDVLRRRWLVVIAAILVAIVMIAISIAPITFRGVAWWDSWQANLGRFTQGNVGDPTPVNPVRHQLLNLHYPLHCFIENRAVVKAMVLAIVGGFALVFFRRWVLDFLRVNRDASDQLRCSSPKKWGGGDLLLPLSMIAVLCLMIVYHRFYDGVLLLLPLAWAIRALGVRRTDPIAWGLLALLIPYFLNAATALKMIEQKVALPSWLLDAWWWDSLVIPMQAWALPLMAILLIAAREREGRRDDVYGCHDEA